MADVVKLVEASGIPYRITPSAVCLEGTWEELILLIRKCHERALERDPHVMTTISIDDEKGSMNVLGESSRLIEEKVTNPSKGWKPKIRNVKPSMDVTLS